jgi:hypothetical protein
MKTEQLHAYIETVDDEMNVWVFKSKTLAKNFFVLRLRHLTGGDFKGKTFASAEKYTINHCENLIWAIQPAKASADLMKEGIVLFSMA